MNPKVTAKPLNPKLAMSTREKWFRSRFHDCATMPM